MYSSIHYSKGKNSVYTERAGCMYAPAVLLYHRRSGARGGHWLNAGNVKGRAVLTC